MADKWSSSRLFAKHTIDKGLSSSENESKDFLLDLENYIHAR